MEYAGAARLPLHRQRHAFTASVCVALQTDTVVVAARIMWILLYRSNAEVVKFVLHCGANAVPFLASGRVYAQDALEQRPHRPSVKTSSVLAVTMRIVVRAVGECTHIRCGVGIAQLGERAIMVSQAAL